MPKTKLPSDSRVHQMNNEHYPSQGIPYESTAGLFGAVPRDELKQSYTTQRSNQFILYFVWLCLRKGKDFDSLM